MPVGIVFTLVSVGLMVHAAKTGRFMPWFYVILFLPGLGALAYVLVELVPEWTGSYRGQRARRQIASTLNPKGRYRELVDELAVVDTIANRSALAEECLRLGKFEEARAQYETISPARWATRPVFLLGRARAEFGLGAGRTGGRLARGTANSAGRTTSPLDGHLLYARALEETGRVEEALLNYEDVARYYPGSEPRVRQARLLLAARTPRGSGGDRRGCRALAEAGAHACAPQSKRLARRSRTDRAPLTFSLSRAGPICAPCSKGKSDGRTGQWRMASGRQVPCRPDGRFVRPDPPFRNWITPDGAPGPSGAGGFKAEPGRYHLYVSLACPWAHRTLIFRKLKGLQGMIGLSVVHWHMGADGWTFEDGPGSSPTRSITRASCTRSIPPRMPDHTGRVTVPVLWDRATGRIVNNESSEIIRMFNSAFDGVGAAPGDYYPADLRAEIDALNERIYGAVNNGVYKAGFAREAGALRGSGARAVRHARLARRAARDAPLAVRRTAHRGRLAAVRHPDPLRSRLCRPFQMQHPAHRRLSESVALSARTLRPSRRRGDGRPPPHQEPLLPEPSLDQSERRRAARARNSSSSRIPASCVA